MKKLLALALTLALISALTISSFAADLVLGDQTGVPSFDSTTFNNLVDITVTAGQVQSRYAVDVVFETFSIAVTGSELTWNVNTLQYDNTAAAGDDLDIVDRPITIYNRSDKPIDVSATCVDSDDEDGVTIAINGTSENTAFTVDAARVGTEAVDSRRGVNSFTVSVTSDDWNDVANYYARDLLQNNVKSIGKISITIAPSN